MSADFEGLFPELSSTQWRQLRQYATLLQAANRKVNLISRKDIDHVWAHHILPSLTLLKTGRFTGRETILDVGTGGGLPGIPLAIAFPRARLTLLDSTLRKVRMLWHFIDRLGLRNVRAYHQRVEEHKAQYAVVTGRAVTEFQRFVSLTRQHIAPSSSPASGWWYFTGGDIVPYRQKWGQRLRTYPLHPWLPLPYFEEKWLLHLKPQHSKRR